MENDVNPEQCRICGSVQCRGHGDHSASVSMDLQRREWIAQQRDLEHRQQACASDLSVDEFYVDQTSHGEHELVIVRDDKLCGGTKSRIVEHYMQTHADYDEFVYPTSWFGGAQVALAWGGKQTGKKVVLFTPPLPKILRPAFVRMAEQLGAEYHFTESYHEAAMAYVREDPSRRLAVENGLGSAENVAKLVEIAELFKREYNRFDELWVAVGSGTLLNSLQLADLADEYYGVCVFHRCPQTFGQAKPRYPVESFEEPALEPPLFPSASHYDAKVMRELKRKVRDGPKRILFWNVM